MIFLSVEAWAKTKGVGIERRGRSYNYWNIKEGGGIVGSANTLKEAVADIEDEFTDEAIAKLKR